MVAEGNVGLAFGLTIGAGLATTAGCEGGAGCHSRCYISSNLPQACCVAGLPCGCCQVLPDLSPPCNLLLPACSAAVVFCASIAQPKLLAGSLGFAAGVML